ncbi:hypothetical protein FRC17_006270, partial [Serendipita sp. 399]
MANPQQQYPYQPRPPSAAGHGMMNMNMVGMMGAAPQGLSIGNPTMGGMSGMPNPAMGGMGNMNAMPTQHMNQYPVQMRPNGMGQPMHGQMPPQPGQGMYGGSVPLHNPNSMTMQNPGMVMGRPPQQGYPPSYPGQQPAMAHNPYGQPQQAQYGSMGLAYGTRMHQPAAVMQPQHGVSGTIPGSLAGYQPNGMMTTGPGRPPSAMGLHQPTPMMPGMAPPGMNMGMTAPSGTPVQGMKPPHTPTTTSMNPPHMAPQQQTPMMSNGIPLSQPPSHPVPGHSPAGSTSMNPAGMNPQMMQYSHMQYRPQQPPQPHQQMGTPGQGPPMNPSISIPNYGGQPMPQTPQTPQQPSSVTQASPVSSTVGAGQHPQTPQNSIQPVAIHRTPTPSSATSHPAQTPNPPVSAPTPVHASGTPTSATAYNRPPSAAGSASGAPGSAGGMMPPPPPGGMPGKASTYPGPMNGAAGMPPNMNASAVNQAMNLNMGMGMDPSALTQQLHMLGQQVGMSGVSSVGPGMFNNPVVPPQAGAAGAMQPGMNGIMPQGAGPGAHRLHQASSGLSRSVPNLRQPPIPPHQPLTRPGMPLTTSGPPGSSHVPISAGMPPTTTTATPNVNHPAMMARSGRPGEIPTPSQPHFPHRPGSAAAVPHAQPPPTTIPGAPVLPSGSVVPATAASQPQQPPQNIAERTMSPRQRAAVIHTITRISAVAADDKDHPLSETLPDLDEAEIEKVHAWIEKDRKYES